jgi:hypothetical protein
MASSAPFVARDLGYHPSQWDVNQWLPQMSLVGSELHLLDESRRDRSAPRLRADPRFHPGAARRSDSRC